jgi:hypothetical protein
MKKACTIAIALYVALSFVQAANSQTVDPLPSWNDGSAKHTIVQFVEAVTKDGGPDYVPPEDRIATFDNDGTLCMEHPIYTQLMFAFERVKELAPQHPEWKTTQPFSALLEGDMKTVGASGMKGFMEIVMATHSGMTATEFAQEASKWLRIASSPATAGVMSAPSTRPSTKRRPGGGSSST